MALIESRSFVAENGFSVAEESTNNIGPFYTGGTSSPVGLDLSQNTFYVQNTGNKTIVWQKFGAGVNDWIIYPASDISFDPSGLDINSTSVQDAIETQVGRNLGKDFAETVRTDSQSVSGSTFVIRDTLNFNSNGGGVNKYRLSANFTYSHNSASNDIRVQILINGSLITEMREEPKDPNGDQRFARCLVAYVENLADGSNDFVLQFRPATASRTSTMYYSVLEAWRVE